MLNFFIGLAAGILLTILVIYLLEIWSARMSGDYDG